jgi:hypothetical protein
MKTYKIPVIWTMLGDVYVEADSLEDAVDNAQHEKLPDGSYLEGSYEVRTDEIEDVDIEIS